MEGVIGKTFYYYFVIHNSQKTLGIPPIIWLVFGTDNKMLVTEELG